MIDLKLEKCTKIDHLEIASIQSILTKNLKRNLRVYFMKGLCQKCHSSNVEITLQEGIPVCDVCTKKTD